MSSRVFYRQTDEAYRISFRPTPRSFWGKAWASIYLWLSAST